MRITLRVVDKKKDISVLKALGLRDQQVSKLFVQLGLLITAIGILFGFALALIIYYVQKEFGIVGVPSSFMMDAYPVQIRASDFLLVGFTVLIIGTLASILPALKAAKKLQVLR